MSDAPLCPETGLPMVRGARTVRLSYKTESATFDMPGWYADGSAEGIHTPEDTGVSDRVLAAMKIRADRLLPPEEVRRIRRGLGLSQREAGQVIGGGPNAFQKYESGEILTSKAVSNLLRVLDAYPDALTRLREVEGAGS